jgi:primosomal protein N'
MVAVRLDARDPTVVRDAAGRAAEAARSAAARAGVAVTVRGPAEAPLAMLRGRVRWQVWLAAHDRLALLRAARAAGDAAGAGGDLRVVVDVDPQSVL